MGQAFGEYELLRHIATGGMAEIFLAQHTAGLDRTLIIKRMLPELAVREDFVRMFLDEAKLTASLQHPHVVRVHDLGQVDNAYFIAMELVDGPHLGALFAHSLRARKPLPIELCVWIMARAADGLEYAHNLNDPSTGKPLNLVHRDISPQNILVSRHGEVKVTDFGVAKASTQQTKTRTGIVKGKVSYMSPEQCLGEVVDHRSDVFALGVVLYELLTRKRLFRDKSDLLVMQRITSTDAPPPSTVNQGVDPELDAIVKRSMGRALADRYACAADFAEALDGWLMNTHRQADELTMSTWFADNCPELAPTATLGARAEATVAIPFSPRLDSADAPTSATPSFSMSGGQRVTQRLDQAVLAPPSPVEATTITAPPNFSGLPTMGLSQPSEAAPGPAADTAGDAPEVESSPSVDATAVMSAPAVLPDAPTRRRPVPILLAAAVAVIVVVAVGIGTSGSSPEASAPPPPDVTMTNSPPTPVAVGAVGTIRVSTVPADVPILVGDRVVGRSPVSVERPAGDLVVQAQFPGQPVQSRTVAVTGGGTVDVDFEAKVPLVVTSTPPRAKVRLDGELLGETPFDRGYLVEPGVVLQLRLDPPGGGYEGSDHTLTAVAGEPLVLDVELAKEQRRPSLPPPVAAGMGQLSIRTDPTTFVQIKGEKIGETPFVEQAVKAGRQTLVLRNPDKGLDERLTVTIPKGKTLVVILKFEKGPTGWKLEHKTIR